MDGNLRAPQKFSQTAAENFTTVSCTLKMSEKVQSRRNDLSHRQ